ncbi:uncharacterized protein TM35_000391980 [Trypanosoma theileri]|uniref:Uncharacterized protein n=1 Tax=Trypanosoma theileri TaxID=67003 RepID=A0A1X0NJT1_9TRYP|nr:uncharacterized protein TM35_000391980 [Trypanosoma theileri]ORC85024.1 hypothetical protein TM35_000391980 [Trypanosoma theileri]
MQKNVNINKGSPGEVHHLPSFPLQSPEKTTAREATVQQTTHTFVSAFRQCCSSHHRHHCAIKQKRSTTLTIHKNNNINFILFCTTPFAQENTTQVKNKNHTEGVTPPQSSS